MSFRPVSNLVREYFHAYDSKNREALEGLLSADFTFSSPMDDNIGAASYFERCWPNSANHGNFEIERCVEDGTGAYVTYTCERTDGARFRNTEFFVTEGDRIKRVDVFFGADTGGKSDEAEVQVVIEGTVEAIRAKDPGALMEFYAPGVLAFDLITPLQYHGAATVGKRAGEWLSSFDGEVDYELLELKITAGEKTAFAHSLNHVWGVQQGKALDMWWRSTLCLKKRDDRWLITHEHSSMPFDMKTGQAVMDQRP